MAQFDVIVVGALHLDIMVDGPRLPALDETVMGSSWRFKCGGKGGNQAVAASRFGAQTAMIGCVGADAFGDQLLAHLDRSGVDRARVAINSANGSGMSVAIADPAGNYGAVIVSGANRSIDPDGFSDLAAKVVLLQNEIPEAINLAAARAAREAGATVVLNAGPARPLPAELLALVHVVVANRVEADMLPRDFHGSAIHTLGEHGVVVDGLQVPPHAVQQVSAHGAGDCFMGALASRLGRGEDLHRSARFANAAAALFVSRDEAAQALLLSEDVLALL